MTLLAGTPFERTPGADEADFLGAIRDLAQQVELLRSAGKLTPETLRNYYGESRYEQVTESNQIEGSTLDVGETQLAILKGSTMFAHDPRYVQDAVALNRALGELEKLAAIKTPLTITEVSRIHELVLADRPGAGSLRKDAVLISGSKHVPPKTWDAVMTAMEGWQSWSDTHSASPTLLRAAVLHAWFVFIHPYIDGNGRTARALTSLELIRGGYPPLIIRKNRDRERYVDALESADFGDLRPFLELITDRATDALRDLERSASQHQGYSQLVQRERKAYENRLGLWNIATSYLFEAIQLKLRNGLEGSDVELSARRFANVSLDDFIDLSKGERVSASWAFSIRCRRPHSPDVEYLAWADQAGETLGDYLRDAKTRPSLRWSLRELAGPRVWRRASADESPYAVRFTFRRDRWVVVTKTGVREYEPLELAGLIADAIIDRLVPDHSL
ncbi:MAG: Fic family protein [Polyangiaceae bacterium]